MNKCKLLKMVLLCFSFVVLTDGLASAERDCTRQVERSDGTKTVTVDCSSSYTETSQDFWNRYLYSTLVQNLKNSLRWDMQYMQDRLSEIFSTREHSSQVMADMKEKEQETADAQQMKQQQQESRMEDLKERQEMQKEHQQSVMQGLSDR